MRLKELRAGKNLTQAKLAKMLGVSRTTVTMWENGASQPDNDTLLQIAAILETSVDELLGGQKKSPTEQAVSEKARELDAVMDNLSEEDQRRVLEFAQNLAMTMQKQEPSK